MSLTMENWKRYTRLRCLKGKEVSCSDRAGEGKERAEEGDKGGKERREEEEEERDKGAIKNGEDNDDCNDVRAISVLTLSPASRFFAFPFSASLASVTSTASCLRPPPWSVCCVESKRCLGSEPVPDSVRVPSPSKPMPLPMPVSASMLASKSAMTSVMKWRWQSCWKSEGRASRASLLRSGYTSTTSCRGTCTPTTLHTYRLSEEGNQADKGVIISCVRLSSSMQGVCIKRRRFLGYPDAV